MRPSELDPARYREIDAAFEHALALSPGERADFLERVGAGDEGLRRHVEALLRASETTGHEPTPGNGTGKSPRTGREAPRIETPSR